MIFVDGPNSFPWHTSTRLSVVYTARLLTPNDRGKLHARAVGNRSLIGRRE